MSRSTSSTPPPSPLYAAQADAEQAQARYNKAVLVSPDSSPSGPTRSIPSARPLFDELPLQLEDIHRFATESMISVITCPSRQAPKLALIAGRSNVCAIAIPCSGGYSRAMTAATNGSSPRIERLQIQNYRSVGQEPVTVRFPTDGPLVILGENNAGKSNINRAIEHLFGERWPGTFQPEPHDFHGRDGDGVAIKISAATANLWCDCGKEISYIQWEHESSRRDGEPTRYVRRCGNGNCHRTFMTKDLRSQLFCMLVGAERGLTYQLSYASKFTLLSKLMHRFHAALLSDHSRKAALSGIFESIVTQFDGVREFSEFRRILTDMTAELAGNLSYRLDIDFAAYDPSNFFKSLRVQPHLAGEVRSFDELGSGQAEILALSFAYAYAKAFGQTSGLILVIDEPESHLHPVAQQWLARRLNDLVTDGLQIVITTHSPHFVNLSQPENLLFARRENGSSPTHVRQLDRAEFTSSLIELGADSNRTTLESVGEFYSAASTTEIVGGIFARACVIVEGRTEAFALPDLLRSVGFEPLRHGIAFVSVDGVSNLAKWLRFYHIVGLPVYPVLDTDADKNGKEAQTSLAAREDLMRALGVDVAQAERMPPDAFFVGEKFASLGPNFEGAMKALLGTTWDDLSSEAIECVGSSKPLIARYVSQHLDKDSLSVDLRIGLESLKSTLEGFSTLDEKVQQEAPASPIIQPSNISADDIPF
jgi:putative ATP-dependent endonuclease of OLD family